MRDRASDLRAIADGRLMLNVRNGVTVARSMLAMIADEFETMSTALAAKDAELIAALHMLDLSKATTEAVLERAERAEAELAAVQVSNNKWLAKWERAEAQLAEANKALEQAEQQLDYGQVDAAHRIIIRATQRAREQGGENNG